MRWKIATCCFVLPLLLASIGCGGPGSSEKSFYEQISELESKEPPARARGLLRIARKQAKTQDTEGAKNTLTLAMAACQAIADPIGKANALADLAQTQADLGYSADVASSAQAALSAAEKVENPELRAKAIATAGRALAIAGTTDKAIASLERAEETASSLEDPTGRVQVLCLVASGYDKASKATEADRVLGATLAYAQSLEGEKVKAIAIGTVAREQAALERPEASKTFDEALATARKASDPGDEVIALLEIADLLKKSKQGKLAREVLAEAEKKCAKITAPDQQKQLLDRARALMG